MALTMIDVGGVSDVAVEDEVVVFGQHKNESVTVDEIAASLNTINYEIVSSVTGRVPRVYIKKSS
jgi:alanine racemase